MEYDVVIVGAGPAGLASAIRLKQLAQKTNQEISVCILEKGSEVGSHILSGCVMDPLGLDELIPDWRDLLDNLQLTSVTEDKLLYLTKKSSFKLPLPRDWSNLGNSMISLGQLCRELARYAENLGVEIYPGFAGKELIIERNVLCGVITGDVGLNRDGSQSSSYQIGMEIRAKQTMFAEGCRGSLSKQAIKYFHLDDDSKPQTYGLGIKELWRVKNKHYKVGTAIHTIGFPLDNATYGGGFIYHLADNKVAIGLVTALDYANPYLSPYDEFQRFKLHPQLSELLKDGERLEYGARTVVEGGLQALPKLAFAGGVLCGDSAGFINVPKVKGVHNALKSGMIAAQAVFNALQSNSKIALDYHKLFKSSWLYRELHAVRNIRPAFQAGRLIGMLYAGFEKFILKGRSWWTLSMKQADHTRILHKSRFAAIDYPAYDGEITFDKASSVHLANVSHDDNQPIHLQLRDSSLPITVNWKEYAAPETRFCPAGVYEIVHLQGEPSLQINAQNCVHCKACDIKDPRQNIIWTVPEGGSGPQYGEM